MIEDEVASLETSQQELLHNREGLACEARILSARLTPCFANDAWKSKDEAVA
jgi:hypothetical protein